MGFLAEMTVHESVHARVRDVRCSCPAGAPARAECSSATQAIIPRRGYFQCETAGARLPADPNQALFLRLGDEFRMHHPAAGGDDCLTVSVDEEAWDRALGSARAVSATLSPATRLAVARLLAALSSGLLSPLEADAATLHLLGLLARDAGARGTAGGQSRPLRRRAARTVARATAYLAGQAGRPATLAEVGAAAHCSPYHLTTLFRRVTGMPLHRYHLRWRMALALDRIARGEGSLQAVALDAGFSSASHFSNAVRGAFGAPPGRLFSHPAARRGKSRKNLQALPAGPG